MNQTDTKELVKKKEEASTLATEFRRWGSYFNELAESLESGNLKEKIPATLTAEGIRENLGEYNKLRKAIDRSSKR